MIIIFIVAFDLLNKDGTTLTIKEISRLFGPEGSSSARAMEMFLAGVVRDSEHGEVNEELTRDEFKGLVCTEGTQMSSALEMFTVSLTANPDTESCQILMRLGDLPTQFN